MDRLAAHVIATAALTVILATVPVLFADACHAATATATTSDSAAAATSAGMPAAAPAVLAAAPAQAQRPLRASSTAAAAVPAVEVRSTVGPIR